MPSTWKHLYRPWIKGHDVRSCLRYHSQERFRETSMGILEGQEATSAFVFILNSKLRSSWEKKYLGKKMEHVRRSVREWFMRKREKNDWWNELQLPRQILQDLAAFPTLCHIAHSCPIITSWADPISFKSRLVIKNPVPSKRNVQSSRPSKFSLGRGCPEGLIIQGPAKASCRNRWRCFVGVQVGLCLSSMRQRTLPSAAPHPFPSDTPRSLWLLGFPHLEANTLRWGNRRLQPFQPSVVQLETRTREESFCSL